VPLPAGSVALGGRSRLAYRDLVSGFRVRLTRAANALSLGQDVEAKLEKEPRLLAKDLPALRHRVEVASRQATPVSDKQADGGASPWA
jgi:hypothetical protein